MHMKFHMPWGIENMLKIGKIWSRNQYARSARDVAPALLGQYIIHETPQGILAGRIVETEAYGGTYRRQADDGSHAFRGLTARTEPMFRCGGWSYIYLIYGMYCCMNVVTGPAGEGQAVLIRAVEPVEGMPIMCCNRHAERVTVNLTNGPGKLCQAMALTRSENGLDLCASHLYIASPAQAERISIHTSKRIHIDYAVKGKEFPWRFYIAGHPFVSKG